MSYNFAPGMREKLAALTPDQWAGGGRAIPGRFWKITAIELLATKSAGNDGGANRLFLAEIAHPGAKSHVVLSLNDTVGNDSEASGIIDNILETYHAPSSQYALKTDGQRIFSHDAETAAVAETVQEDARTLIGLEFADNHTHRQDGGTRRNFRKIGYEIGGEAFALDTLARDRAKIRMQIPLRLKGAFDRHYYTAMHNLPKP